MTSVSAVHTEERADGRPRARRFEVVTGLLLVAGFALAGAWLSSGSTDEVSALAARVDIERGSTIGAEQLRVVDVTAAASLNMVAVQDAAGLIGQIAHVDISAGTLLTIDDVATDATLASGHGVVGLSLGSGRYPSASLGPGDTVRVVRHSPAEPTGAPNVEVLVAEASVVAMTRPGSQGDVLISLTMAITDADVVAAATAENRVSLIHVTPGEQ